MSSAPRALNTTPRRATRPTGGNCSFGVALSGPTALPPAPRQHLLPAGATGPLNP